MPIVLYLLIGGLTGAGAAFGLQYAILWSAGALPAGVPAARLALDVMTLPRYAAYAALFAAAVSVLSRHWHDAWLRLCGWLAAAITAGLGAGLAPLWWALERRPSLVEAIPAVTPANRYLFAGLATAAVCIVLESLLARWRNRHRGAAFDDDDLPVDFDRVTGEEMRARAAAWLAARERAARPDPPSDRRR